MMDTSYQSRSFEGLLEYIFENLIIGQRLEINIWRPIVGALLLLFFSPLLLLISALVLVLDPGPIFYKQLRVGKHSIPFNIYKFRSMKVDAEASTGPILSHQNDVRVTTLGRILRSLHLDELPQLFNVVKGEMNFIGPRPERPFFTEKYCEQLPKYAHRFNVRPGITGLAQVMLPYNAPASDKILFDLFYLKYRHSLLLNVIIVFLTLLKMVQVPFASPRMNAFIKGKINE